MSLPIFSKLTHPQQGSRVAVDPNGRWQIPDDPIVCLLRGDGIGMDVGSVPGISACAVKVLDAAVQKSYGGRSASSGSMCTPATWPASSTVPRSPIPRSRV
jgi:hypothetical protein